MPEQDPQRHEKHKAVPELPHDDTEHGEGNREADRHYREGVQRTLRDKDVERLAKDAEEALEGEEGDELRAAEEEGRRHIAEEDPQLYKRRGSEGGGGAERR